MKRFLPSTQELWATTGMFVVSLIAIFGKGPLSIGIAALAYAIIQALLLWATPEECAAKPQEILKDL